MFAAAVFVVLTVTGAAHSQERVLATGPVATGVPVEARFEAVQVLYAKEPLLLRLDKYTGEVFELARNRDFVRDKGQTNAWQLTKWNNRPLPEEIDAQRVNFQIFGNPNNDGSAYLLNVNTGDTWSLYRDPSTEREFSWVPVKTQKR
jgi:hypothetical protein